MSKELKTEMIIWKILTQLIQYHSAYHPKAENILPEDRILMYFPTPLENKEKPYDEHANRFGEVILDMIENANEIFGLNPPIQLELEFREEWKIFSNVGDVFTYMFSTMKKSQKT